MTEDVKPLILATIPNDGAQRWYRFDKPLEAASRAGYIEHAVHVHGDTGKMRLPAMMAASNLVLFSNPRDIATVDLIKACREDLGTPVAVDIDDNLWCVDPTNYSYFVWGRARHVAVEIPGSDQRIEWVEGRKYPWHGVVHPYRPDVNRLRIRCWMNAMREADAVICSTWRLAQAVQRWKGWRLNPPGRSRETKLLVLPNMMNVDLWPTVDRASNRSTFRILYQGGSSHFGDLVMIWPIVKAFLAKHPRAKFVLFGSLYKHLVDQLDQKQFEWIPGVEDEADYIRTMVEADCDVCLAPLEPTPFNICKSPLKFYQAALSGMLTIASDVPPYWDVMHCEKGTSPQSWTGLLAHDARDWFDALEWAMENPRPRLQIMKNARLWVETRVNASRNVSNILDVYGECIGLPNPLSEAGARARARTRQHQAPRREKAVGEPSLS